MSLSPLPLSLSPAPRTPHVANYNSNRDDKRVVIRLFWFGFYINLVVAAAPSATDIHFDDGVYVFRWTRLDANSGALNSSWLLYASYVRTCVVILGLESGICR